jgi:hypothetical protein
MTQFAETLRHRCRNPRCRMKLKAPVENPHDAFCTRGCYTSFHRKRCVVCEAPMERKTEQQLVCGKRRCRNALQARQSQGRYLASSNGVSPLESPIKPGIKIDSAVDRPWRRIIAGPPLTPNQFHCATVPDGPDDKLKDGAFDRIEGKNRTALKVIEDSVELTEPEWREVINPDGVKCFVTRFRDAQMNGVYSDWAPSWQSHWAAQRTISWQSSSADDDLSIPDFLKR